MHLTRALSFSLANYLFPIMVKQHSIIISKGLSSDQKMPSKMGGKSEGIFKKIRQFITKHRVDQSFIDQCKFFSSKPSFNVNSFIPNQTIAALLSTFGNPPITSLSNSYREKPLKIYLKTDNP